MESFSASMADFKISRMVESIDFFIEKHPGICQCPQIKRGFIAGAAVFYVSQSGSNTAATASTPLSSTSTAVTFPASLFEDGKARHFEHVDGKFTIRYFVLKSSDGVIRAAFDACDVCWPANKGYYQEGDYMVCRNCGRKFASVLVNEVKGGCNPAPLNRTLESGKLVIQVKDIQEGRQFFNFAGKA